MARFWRCKRSLLVQLTVLLGETPMAFIALRPRERPGVFLKTRRLGASSQWRHWPGSGGSELEVKNCGRSTWGTKVAERERR